MTEGQLRSKRDEFWDTAPAFDGRKEIWDALRAAALAAECNDLELAQAIVDGACITLPHGMNPRPRGFTTNTCANTYAHIYKYMYECVVMYSANAYVIIFRMSKDTLQNPMHQLFRDYCCNCYITVAVLRDHCEQAGARKARTESDGKKKTICSYVFTASAFVALNHFTSSRTPV